MREKVLYLNDVVYCQNDSYMQQQHIMQEIECLIVLERSNPNNIVLSMSHHLWGQVFFISFSSRTRNGGTGKFNAFSQSSVWDSMMETASTSILRRTMGNGQISQQLMIILSLGASGFIDVCFTTIFTLRPIVNSLGRLGSNKRR